MEALGDRLRKARKAKGLTIEELHNATKIRVVYLNAMEEGKFHELPGDVYVRGFLRNIAKVTGIAGDELVLEYDRIRRDSRIALTVLSLSLKEPIKERDNTVKAIPIIVIILIIAAALIITIGFRGLRDKSDDNTVDVLTIENDSHSIPETENDTGAEIRHDVEEVQDINSVQDTGEIGLINNTKDSHELSVVVTERCWVRVIADGQRLFERTMLPGEIATWTASRDIQMKLGNAGGIDITCNGIHMGPPGKSGDVIELTFPVPGL